MENNKYITVSQLNKYLKYKIDNDTNLGIVFLKGEISNFKNHKEMLVKYLFYQLMV